MKQLVRQCKIWKPAVHKNFDYFAYEYVHLLPKTYILLSVNSTLKLLTITEINHFLNEPLKIFIEYLICIRC